MSDPIRRESTEKTPAPERAPVKEAELTRPHEAAEHPSERPVPSAAPTTSHAPKPQAVSAVAPKDPLTRKIESILEEDLQDVYFSMNEADRARFKTKGDETASKIKDLLARAHVKAKEIVNLLIDWLKLIPGVNRFFLEQEAKIKAEKILAIKK